MKKACLVSMMSVVFATSAARADGGSGPSNVTVPAGYSLVLLAGGLDFPTAVAFSEDRIWVAEAGIDPAPAIKEIDSAGNARTILSPDMLPDGTFLGPLTDVTFQDGELWVTHRQVGANGWFVGAISRFDPDAPATTFRTMITNLPSAGDHFTEEIIFDHAGRAYFSQGSATNSSVVGADNDSWLELFPTFHDFPPVDISLDGISFQTAVPFKLDPDASKFTPPYRPFGSGFLPPDTVLRAATSRTPREGMIAGTAAVYSFDPRAADPALTLNLEGWGFRNPYGIGIDPFNPDRLFASNNGADTRSAIIDGQLLVNESRPIEHDFDDMFVMRIGGTPEFFGWPDFFHDPETGAVLPVTDPLFCDQSEHSFPCPPFVLSASFRQQLRVQPAFAQFEEHSSANKFDFSTQAAFGFVGDLFVAETGSFPPGTGAEELTGYKVVRVSRGTGEVTDFIAPTSNTEDVIFQPEGFNKPIDVKFRGDRMLIVDFGVADTLANVNLPGTGKLWVLQRSSSADCAD
jgi:glucose/arabinose dehydrogenase